MRRYFHNSFFRGGFFGYATDAGSGQWTEEEIFQYVDGMKRKKKKVEKFVIPSYLDRYWK